MRLLGRLILAALGLVLAVPCGALALAVGAIGDPALRDLGAALGVAGAAAILDALAAGMPETGWALARGALLAVLVLVALPPGVAALVGELVGTRRAAWYGGVGGALSAALPWLARTRGPGHDALPAEARLTVLLFVAGAASGLAYWIVAGRSAGPGAGGVAPVPPRP